MAAWPGNSSGTSEAGLGIQRAEFPLAIDYFPLAPDGTAMLRSIHCRERLAREPLVQHIADPIRQARGGDCKRTGRYRAAWDFTVDQLLCMLQCGPLGDAGAQRLADRWYHDAVACKHEYGADTQQHPLRFTLDFAQCEGGTNRLQRGALVAMPMLDVGHVAPSFHEYLAVPMQ